MGEGWKVILMGLYQRNMITVERLDASVVKGLITEEEKQEILDSVVVQ